MDIEKQIFALRNGYLEEMKRVYDKKLQMRLMAVIAFNRHQYERNLKTIEVISSIIEGAVTDCNPKRMLRYIVMLHEVIDNLVSQIDADYQSFWEDKLP